MYIPCVVPFRLLRFPLYVLHFLSFFNFANHISPQLNAFVSRIFSSDIRMQYLPSKLSTPAQPSLPMPTSPPLSPFALRHAGPGRGNQRNEPSDTSTFFSWRREFMFHVFMHMFVSV